MTNSLGETNLCGTAVISRAFAALSLISHDISQVFLPLRGQFSPVLQVGPGLEMANLENLENTAFHLYSQACNLTERPGKTDREGQS